ncbi:MAG: ArnT family glycosyltransferase, partial [Bacteroidaceae bacterium]
PTNTNATKRSSLTMALVMVIMMIIFVSGNTSMRPDLMEVRNLVTAREMVTDHHIMVPTMNGELRLEKPPLPTWIAAVVEYISPDNIAAQRTVTAIMGCLWAWWLYLLAFRLTRRRDYALVAIMVFATCYPVVLQSRTATWDIYCHSFMAGAMYYLYPLFYESRRVITHSLLTGLLFGLSLMSKGPVAVYALFLPFLIAIVWYRRPILKGKGWGICLAIITAAIVGCWWYLYLHIFATDHLAHVVDKESGSWLNHNVRPWWYYWRFFLETGVWSVLMITTIIVRLRRDDNLSGHTSRQWSMTLLWTFSALILLSLLPEKKMRYLLPMMMPCALAMTYTLFQITTDKSVPRFFFIFNKWLLAIITVSLPIVYCIFMSPSGIGGMAITILFAIGCLAIALYIAATRHHGGAMRLSSGVFALFALTSIFVLPDTDKFFGNTNARSISTFKNDTLLKQLPLYYIETPNHHFRIDMVYLTNHKITLINHTKAVDTVSATLSPELLQPCALLADSATASSIKNIATLHNIAVDDRGAFDDNINARNKRHHNTGLRNNLIILKPQNTTP